MIELINVTKWFPTDLGRHYVFRNVSLKLPLDKSVGVIGPNGAGKSTFLRIIAGADIPNEGRVIRSGRISPPMGLTPSLLSSLTGAENARFACRIYGMERDEMEEVVEKVAGLAGIGKYYNMPVGTYSAGMRQRVAFSISMMLHYDYYLFDEIGAGGDRQFQEISKRMVEERLATSKFVITSHRIDELVGLCEACIVIMNGELKYFDKIADGVTYYGDNFDIGDITKKIERKSKRKERKSREESGLAPPTREERRAAKKELKLQRTATETTEGQQAGAAGPEGGLPEKRKKRRKKSGKAVAAPLPPAVLEVQAMAPSRPAVSTAPLPGPPARTGLPMAPRIKLPPVMMDSEADQKIAQIREHLAHRTGHETSTSPGPVDAIVVAFPDAGESAREDRRMLRRLRRTAVVPPGAGSGHDAAARRTSAAKAQERAARKAERAMRMLLEALGHGGTSQELEARERLLALAASAQEAAAMATLKACAALDEMEAGGEGSGPARVPAVDAPRTKRKDLRRRRQRASLETEQAQPETGTSDP